MCAAHVSERVCVCVRAGVKVNNRLVLAEEADDGDGDDGGSAKRVHFERERKT